MTVCSVLPYMRARCLVGGTMEAVGEGVGPRLRIPASNEAWTGSSAISILACSQVLESGGGQ